MTKSMFSAPALFFAAGAFFAANTGYAVALPMHSFGTTPANNIEKVLCKQGGKHCTPASTIAKVPKGPNAPQIPGSGWEDPDCKEFHNCGYAGADSAKGTAPVKTGTTTTQNKPK